MGLELCYTHCLYGLQNVPQKGEKKLHLDFLGKNDPPFFAILRGSLCPLRKAPLEPNVAQRRVIFAVLASHMRTAFHPFRKPSGGAPSKLKGAKIGHCKKGVTWGRKNSWPVCIHVFVSSLSRITLSGKGRKGGPN